MEEGRKGEEVRMGGQKWGRDTQDTHDGRHGRKDPRQGYADGRLPEGQGCVVGDFPSSESSACRPHLHPPGHQEGTIKTPPAEPPPSPVTTPSPTSSRPPRVCPRLSCPSLAQQPAVVVISGPPPGGRSSLSPWPHTVTPPVTKPPALLQQRFRAPKQETSVLRAPGASRLWCAACRTATECRRHEIVPYNSSAHAHQPTDGPPPWRHHCRISPSLPE